MKDTVQKLLADGWTDFPDGFRPYGFRSYARRFYKRFPTPTRCGCNKDKAGMQVCYAVSEFHGQVHHELDLSGELSDGTWIKIKVLPGEVVEVFSLIPRMLATWEYVANK